MDFPTVYSTVIERIRAVNPLVYSKTRNYLDGSVTCLSPYISRGIISTRLVYDIVRENHPAAVCEAFLKELLWREYFQRLQQQNKHIDTTPARGENSRMGGIPDAFLSAATGITAIDSAITKLQQTGYMHNHIRMYAASLAAIAGYGYYAPAQWMYYHLYDGDVASNFCSWQWIYGLQTGKRYIANQENINHYCGTSQKGTFLDIPYEKLEQLDRIDSLEGSSAVQFTTLLPEHTIESLDITDSAVLIYNSYNLDPLWCSEGTYNRILLLEPSFFGKYPVSEKVMGFILSAAKENIPGVQVCNAEFKDLKQAYPNHEFIAKEHPLFTYPGAVTTHREWLAPNVSGAFTSFSKYFKTVKSEHYEHFR